MRYAAFAAGQVAAYAIKAVQVAVPEGESERAIQELILDYQRLRNDICWFVFDC